MVPPNYPARIRPSHLIEFGCNQVTANSSKLYILTMVHFVWCLNMEVIRRLHIV